MKITASETIKTTTVKVSSLPALLLAGATLDEDPSAEAGVEAEAPEVEPAAVEVEEAAVVAFEVSLPESLKIFASGE